MLLDGMFQSYGFVCLRPGAPSRHGQFCSAEFDYAYVSRPLMATVRRVPGAVVVKVHPDSRHELCSDHDRVSLELALGLTANKRRRRRRRPQKGRCGRWFASPALNEAVAAVQHDFSSFSLQGQWEALKDIQTWSCRRVPSQKFRDSPALKELCSRRRSCNDAAQRQELTKLILSRRRAEQLAWLQDLEHKASTGDASAIRYLRTRATPRHSADSLVQVAGGLANATSAVKDHFALLSEGAPAAAGCSA